MSLVIEKLPISTKSIWRLTVEKYHEMIRLGILTEDDSVELLQGYLITKMPKNPRHRIATKLTRTVLEKIIPEGYYVDSQEPITLKDSEPEPDLVIVKGDTCDYFDSHPQAEDVVLVVEVSDSILKRDQTWKKSLYANENIPFYWIINLIENKLESYSQPMLNNEFYTYHNCQVYSQNDVIKISLFSEKNISIPVKDLFL